MKNETLALVFSCEFCEILKNIFLIEQLRWLRWNIYQMNNKMWSFKSSQWLIHYIN